LAFEKPTPGHALKNANRREKETRHSRLPVPVKTDKHFLTAGPYYQEAAPLLWQAIFTAIRELMRTPQKQL
jgi:hypothetical protein